MHPLIWANIRVAINLKIECMAHNHGCAQRKTLQILDHVRKKKEEIGTYWSKIWAFERCALFLLATAVNTAQFLI